MRVGRVGWMRVGREGWMRVGREGWMRVGRAGNSGVLPNFSFHSIKFSGLLKTLGLKLGGNLLQNLMSFRNISTQKSTKHSFISIQKACSIFRMC